MELSATELKLGPTPDRRAGSHGRNPRAPVRKTLTFHANTYTIDTRVRVENASGGERQALLAFPWTTLQEWEGKTAKFLGQHPTTIAMSAGGELRYTDEPRPSGAGTTGA